MPEEKQIYIYNEAQLSLIKNTFAGNDVLLYTIRKHFLQMDMSDVERGLLDTFVKGDVIKVLKMRMLPELSPELPLGQLSDIFVPLAKGLQERTPEEMQPHLDAKKLVEDYLVQQFNLLEGKTDSSIKLADLRGTDFIKLNAYLYLVGYIDQMLILIKSIAGTKEETKEAQTKRMAKDSTK